jgi:anti-anti-sigma factor
VKVKVSRAASGKAVVELGGSFDREATPEARRTLLKIARKQKAEGLELDFSAVSGIDTAGVAVLIELLRSFSNNGSRLRLTGLPDNVKRVIRLMRLDEVFDHAIVQTTGSEG